MDTYKKLKLLSIQWLGLAFGVAIYLFARSKTTLVFSIVDWLDLGDQIFLIRANTIPISKSLPRWFIYYLPDSLWVLSNNCINIIIWRCQINKRNILWHLSIPKIGISSEFLQFFGFFPGIFDINDILAYCTEFVVPAFAFKLKWSE